MREFTVQTERRSQLLDITSQPSDRTVGYTVRYEMETGAEMTEQQKVQARYSLLMKQTNQTAGDFANTSDQLANRQRILSARWDNARAQLGTALLPMLEDLSGWVLDKGIPAFEDFADWFQGPGIKKIQGFGRFLRDDLAPPLKDAADFAGDLMGWLNDMPKWAKTGGLAGLARADLVAGLVEHAQLERLALLVEEPEVVEALAEVPVGGVEESHRTGMVQSFAVWVKFGMAAASGTARVTNPPPPRPR